VGILSQFPDAKLPDAQSVAVISAGILCHSGDKLEREERMPEMTLLVYFEVLWRLCCLVLCLFTRLFKDTRVSLTLSLFFTVHFNYASDFLQ